MNEEAARKQRELREALDQFFLDWFDDVLHARHLEELGIVPPDWMRSGWYPDGPPPPPTAPEIVEEDVLADDLFLDEMLLDETGMWD